MIRAYPERTRTTHRSALWYPERSLCAR